MTVRSLLLVTLCALPALLLLSCSGGGGQKSPSSTQSRVEGYVFVSPGGSITLGRSATPPAGTSPLPGATITAEGVTGGSTTSANGFFRLSNLDPGNYQLKIQGTASATAPITLFGGATTTVGEPTFSRSQAIDAVRARLAGVPHSTQVALFGPQQPLPIGTTVNPALETRATPLFRAERPTWFFYADPVPAHRFAHRVKYYFVDAESGALTEHDAATWPAINDRFYYYDASEYDTGQDLIQKSPVSIGRSRSQTPVSRASVWLSPNAPVTRDHSQGCQNGKVHVLLIQGDPRHDFKADIDTYSALARAQFRAAKIVEYRPPLAEEDKAPSALTEIRRLWNEVKLGLGPCDTLFVMITAHGFSDGHINVASRAIEVAPAIRGGQNAKVRQAADNVGLFPHIELDLLSTPACHVIVQIQTCYSGKIMDNYRKAIESDTTGRAWGKKIAIFSECSDDEEGAGRPASLPPPGNYFGNEMFLEYIVQAGAANPQTGFTPTVEGASRAFDGATPRTEALTAVNVIQQDGRMGLHPKKYIRIPPPYESCGATTVSGFRAGVDLRNAAGQLVFAAGTPIGLFQLEGHRESEKEEPVTADRGCSERHLHANSDAGVTIKDLKGKVLGTIPDPRKTKCGYGAIVPIPLAELFARQP